MQNKKLIFFIKSKSQSQKKFLTIEDKSYNYYESNIKIKNISKILRKIKCKNIISITRSNFVFFNILISVSELNLAFSPLSNLIKPIFLMNILKQKIFDCLLIDKSIYQSFDKETKNLIEGKIENILLIQNNGNIQIFKKNHSRIKKNKFFLMCFTSGSTGDPKSILLSQQTKILRAKCVIDLYNLDLKEKILITTPLYHTLAFRKLIINLILNSQCFVRTSFDPKAIKDEIKEKN